MGVGEGQEFANLAIEFTIGLTIRVIIAYHVLSFYNNIKI